MNTCGEPSETPASVSSGRVVICGDVMLVIRSKSVVEFMSHGLLRIVVAKSSELPSGSGEVKVSVGMSLTTQLVLVTLLGVVAPTALMPTW